MKGEISLSFDFIDQYVRFAKPEYTQVYLYAKYLTETTGKFPSADELAKSLDLQAVHIEFILEFWASRGELDFNGGEYSFKSSVAEGKPATPAVKAVNRIRSTKPSYSQAEIDGVASKSKQISGMFYQSETILNKVLTASDMELLYSFHDWLGLPIEVIMMLLSYASKKGKTTKRYLETVAIDWADKGIDSFESAEAYISELEAADSAERQVRSILGIYDRGLTATEKKYIGLWVNQQKIPAELISAAYDKTVEYTGKLSWSYMDKMLQSWIASGYKTAEDIKSADEEFRRKNSVQSKPEKKTAKSKFNNYNDGNADKYADLEEQILDLILDSN